MCTKAVLERYSDKFKILYIESKKEEILGLFLPKESFIFQNYMQEIKTWEYILKRVVLLNAIKTKEMTMSSGLIEKNVFNLAPFENWKIKIKFCVY